jgi:hypothetical protein
MNNNDYAQIGVAWRRDRPDGEYISGSIELGGRTLGIVIHVNQFCDHAKKQPTHHVFVKRAEMNDFLDSLQGVETDNFPF